MSAPLDFAAVERAAAGRRLRLPRTPQRGRVGEVRANSVGSSMELHDFRHYQPGDDLRQLDWNAVARTGELVLRVRQDEVAPRLEVVLDASRSMAVSPAKAARTRELCWLLVSLGRRSGLEASLVVAGREPKKAFGDGAREVLHHLAMEGVEPFDLALRKAAPLRPCGLRLVVSDLLFESAPGPIVERWARGATGLFVLQVLDGEDLSPLGGAGARLVDSESGEALERILTAAVLDDYRQRLAGHLDLWREAMQRVRATLLTLDADTPLDQLAAGPLQPLMEAA